MKKKKQFILFIILFISIFTFNVEFVKANCTLNCDPTYKDWNNNENGSGSAGHGACITGSMCQNQNVIILQTEIAHIDTSGKKVYDTVYWTNNPAYAGGKIKYVDWMTKAPNDYGTAATQLEQYLSANNYAATKQLLASAGITNFQNSTNGLNAYGLISQALIQYKNTNGGLSWTTLKDYAATSPTNRARALEYLSQIATGNDALLRYIKGMTSGECASGSLAIAASPMSGCGLNIIDIAQLCEMLGLIDEPIPTPACPGGEMVQSGEIEECYPSKGGSVYGFSNLATSGGRSDVHMQYGQEKEYVGEYCSLFCQEYGSATLPGATGEALSLGSYMIWPTSKESHNNDKFKEDYYPLKFSGTLYCRLGVLPDPNMPGSNGQCYYDPVKDYDDNWKIVNELWDKRDYTKRRFTYEEVRKNFIGRKVKDPQGVCTAIYSPGGKICNTDYVTKEKFLNCTPVLACNGEPLEGTTETCVENEVKRREVEMQKAANAMNSAIAAYNGYGCSEDQTEEVCNAADPVTGNPCPGTYRRLTACAQGKRAAGAAMRAAIATYNAAKAAYDEALAEQKRLQNLIQTIHETIKNCSNYVKAFENDCEILQAMSRCGKYSASGDLYDFMSNVSFNWGDEESYSGLNVSLLSSTKSVTKSSPTVEIPEGDTIDDVATLLGYPAPSFEADVNKIKEREFEITAEDVYTLESNYSYVDKKNLKYLMYPTANYVDLGMNVLPTSYNNKVGKNYQLVLTDISFGSSMSNFGNGAVYACDQEFTKNSDLCVCPENTKHAGKELGGLICDSKDTCADAQAKYCDSEVFPDSNTCDAYCDPPMENVSIAACINAGYTKDECKKKICPNLSGPIKCKNTNGVGGKMDITACVETKMIELGVSLSKAIDICDALVCPNGGKIIYRTIKLENPFPGKDISKIVDGFNNEVKGRYPGYNWNGKLLVYNKIRNNRNGSSTNISEIGLGTKLYQTKQPLYTFVLNGATIERIRNYNSTIPEGYNDFNLICRKNHSAGCRSEFVHNISYGLVSGSCYDGSAANFYTCDN